MGIKQMKQDTTSQGNKRLHLAQYDIKLGGLKYAWTFDSFCKTLAKYVTFDDQRTNV
jgi:hypothetical protein